MHAIKNRPVCIGDKIEARPIMYVALTYDHRIIDGREAVLFLRKIKECVEDPKNILFNIWGENFAFTREFLNTYNKLSILVQNLT